MKEYLRNLRKIVGHMPIVVCGASVIVENREGEILMQLRKDNNCWGYPGGSVDINEVVEVAAKRELLEETGLTANSLELLGVFSGEEMYYKYPNRDEISVIDIVYVCRDYTGEIKADNVENLDVKFFPINKLPDRISPPCIPVLQKYKEKSDWAVHQEIVYYNSLPVRFDDFIEVPTLTDGEIYLVCTAKQPGVSKKNWLPAYDFAVCRGGEKIGSINLRMGYGGGPYNSNCYYGGQIGYGIDEKYRGNGYAVRACCLLLPVARAHNMTKLLITNDVSNTASRRVCEKLGLRLVREVRLPEWHDLYKEGQRFANIYEWDIGVSKSSRKAYC